MGMLEQLIGWLQQLHPVGILALMFFIAYIENIFPPSPSDVLLVFTGTLIGVGTVGFIPALAFSTLGSTAGFVTAYLIGRYFEQHVVSGRFGKYLPAGAIHQVESLFSRFGYGVIVANRFLSGTRAIVSFFAGMSKMNLGMTTVLSAISACVWNFILLYLGKSFSQNWRVVVGYLELYSKVVGVLIGVAIIIFLGCFLRNKKYGVPPSGVTI